jgi:hypothetical protein
VLAIIALVLTPFSRPSLTRDPLIAEAKQLTRQRQALVTRRAAGALILGAALAGAAFLQYHRYVREGGVNLALVYHLVHPWWVYAATLALCTLGVAGAAGLAVNARRAVAIGHAMASVVFLTAGVGAIADTGLVVVNNGGVVGRINLALALLLLGVISAALAWTFWSRLPRSAHPPI